MYKLNRVEKDFPKWVENFGERHYNVAPVGWKEIDFQRYASIRSLYVEGYSDYRQMTRDSNGNNFKNVIMARLFFYSDGIGIAEELRYEPDPHERHKYIYVPHYYLFGCDHEYGAALTDEEYSRVPKGNNMHHQKCKKCGYIDVYDTSD